MHSVVTPGRGAYDEALLNRNESLFGDLYRWWPEDYARWELQQDAENERIAQWLETGVDPGTVSVEVWQGDGTPSHFALGQNYPNPFNPTTTIQFSIVTPQFTTLKVYDILSREVSVLVNERKSPGSYEIRFDQAGLASGVYFYRLAAGRFVSDSEDGRVEIAIDPIPARSDSYMLIPFDFFRRIAWRPSSRRLFFPHSGGDNSGKTAPCR